MVAGAALVAGGGGPLAVRLALSMTLLQLGIGTVNDVVDAPADAGRKPGKPIPAGLVPVSAATALAVACAAGGTALAITVSPALGLLALTVIAIGLLYDLRLKGTAWSWLPFALGIPILPVYGWLGARGMLDPLFGVLVPAAVLGGAALAIANSLVDVERDRAAGRTSVAARLGRHRAARLGMVLLAVVELILVLSIHRPRPLGLVSVGGVLTAVLAAAWSSSRPDLAEWLWRIQAVGLAVAGVAFLALEAQ